ncbi:MAG: ATP-binding protein [Methanomicrobiaceae archaeon]|nr:ATP-binding protein [Methanomicrobiaceae archaeon]
MSGASRSSDFGDLAFFFNLQDEIDIPMLLSDEQGKIRWLNVAMEEFSGISREKATGMEYRELITSYIAPFIEETASFLHDLFSAIDRNERLHAGVYHFVPRGRKDEWIEVKSAPITTGTLAGGRIDIVSFVSGKVQAEEESSRKHAFEEIMARISTSFVDAAPPEFDRRITAIIRDLGTCAGADSCYLTLINGDRTGTRGSFEWFAHRDAPTRSLAGVRIAGSPWTGEVAKQPAIIHTHNATRHRQSLVLPLRGKTIQGFLGFESDQGGLTAFHQYRDHLKMVGDILISVLERCFMEERITRHDAICESVMIASGRLHRTPSWETDIEEVLKALGRGTGASRVYLIENGSEAHQQSRRYLWTEHSLHALPENAIDEKSLWEREELVQWETALTLGHVLTGAVRDLSADLAALFSSRNVLSFAVLPISVAGQCWGFLVFEDCSEERTWHKPEIDALKTAADAVGSTIERSEHEEEIRRRNRQLTAINEIISAAGSVETLYDLLVHALHRIVAVLGMEKGAIYLLDGEERYAVLACTAGKEHTNGAFSELLPLDGAPFASIFQEGVPAFNETITEDAGTRTQVSWVPLSGGGSVVGVLFLSSSGTGRRFSAEEQHTLITAGKEIGTAIYRGLLQQELEESYEKANLYLDILTHDIKNANTVSVMYADMLTEMIAGKPREFAGKLMESISRAIEITDHVSTIRRLHEEKPQLKPMNLDEVIRKEVDRYPDHSIHYNPGGYTVLADDLITEIFANLIGNSIKFGGDEVVVFIRAEEHRSEIEVIIEDTGPGIPDAMKTVIFDRFQRGCKSTSGKGLGLYIVRTLVSRYGGEIWVEDRVAGRPGDGVSFRFLLKKGMYSDIPDRAAHETGDDAGAVPERLALLMDKYKTK